MLGIGCKRDVQDIPRLDNKAPPSPDSAGSDECSVGVEGELFGWASEVGDSGKDDTPLRARFC